MTVASMIAAGAVALAAIGLAGWILRAAAMEFRRNRVTCLLYHQIHPSGGVAGTRDVDPVYACFSDRFTEQMDYLKSSGHTTLTLDDLLRARSGEVPLPPKAVLITFDDGFSSIYRLAYPILQRNAQRATIFVTPDRTSANFRLFSHLDRPLTDAEIAEMSEHGIDIQSHGMTHRFLTELDDEELRSELSRSRAALESVTNRPVRFLAIPGGAYDRRVRRRAREAGYRAVFCMRKGSAGLKDDLFALPRMVVSRDTSLEDFRSLLSPAGRLRGRITSMPQEILSRLIGMRRMDRVRDWLYDSPLAPFLRPAVLPWVLLGAAAAGLLLLALWLVP